MRTSRLQLLAAAGVAVASLARTACEDGTGTRDEGASASKPVASASSDSSSQAPKEGAASGDKGNGSTANGSGGDAAGSGDSGKGSSSGQGSSAGKGSGSGGSDDGPAAFNPCNGSNTSVSAAPVSRPVNHMVITVKNTGSKNCDLTYYPVLRFDEMQWVPQPVEDSKPQAVVTLAPGESGYAGVMLSAADGGAGGTTGNKLADGFQGRTPNSDGGPAAIPSLPADGVYYDSSLTVTYWQYSMDEALTY